jgi:azobenzene reductase
MAIRVLTISGSMRDPSHTRSLTHSVANALRERGANVDVWDVRDPVLPLALPELRAASDYNDPNVQKLGELAKAADGFVWASPIYHNSYTGALKNLLDILHIGYHDMKTVGLLSHGGHRASQAVDHLRIVGRSVGAIVIPKQVSTDNADFVDDPSTPGGFRIESANILDRIGSFSDQFMAIASATQKLHS